jgi:hypothetical protein
LRCSLFLSIPSRIFRPCSFRSSSVISLLIGSPTAALSSVRSSQKNLHRKSGPAPSGREWGLSHLQGSGLGLSTLSELVPVHHRSGPGPAQGLPSDPGRSSEGLPRDARRMITVQERLSPHSRREVESWRLGSVA